MLISRHNDRRKDFSSPPFLSPARSSTRLSALHWRRERVAAREYALSIIPRMNLRAETEVGRQVKGEDRGRSERERKGGRAGCTGFPVPLAGLRWFKFLETFKLDIQYSAPRCASRPPPPPSSSRNSVNPIYTVNDCQLNLRLIKSSRALSARAFGSRFRI